MTRHNYDKNDIDIILEAMEYDSDEVNNIIDDLKKNQTDYNPAKANYNRNIKAEAYQEFESEGELISDIWAKLAVKIFGWDLPDSLHDTWLDSITNQIKSGAEEHHDYEKYEGITYPRSATYFTVNAPGTADDEDIANAQKCLIEDFQAGYFDDIIPTYLDSRDKYTIFNSFIRHPWSVKKLNDAYESLYEQKLEDWEW